MKFESDELNFSQPLKWQTEENWDVFLLKPKVNKGKLKWLSSGADICSELDSAGILCIVFSIGTYVLLILEQSDMRFLDLHRLELNLFFLEFEFSHNPLPLCIKDK